MTTPRRRRFSAANARLLTVVGFALGVIILVGALFTAAGGSIPLLSKLRNYKIAFDVPTTTNVGQFVDVYTAGVPIGKVDSVERHDSNSVRITMALDDPVVPVHEGATVQISEKALTGQPMIRLVPGTGANTYPSGAVLPKESVKPPVQLRDVLASMNKPTRDALGGFVRSLSQSTDGRQKDISGIFAGLSDLGENGDTVLEALGKQSADLMAVSDQLKQFMDAADVGQGQIYQLVSSANKLTAATTGQRTFLEDSMRKLPGVLDSATAASDDITRLSGALHPVAAGLRDAGPDLNDALKDLPDASHDLRRSLGPLHDVLNEAPPTMHRTARFKDKTHDFVPPATVVLRDLNPMLRYMKPYGREIISAAIGFGAGIHHFTDDGQVYVYLKPIMGARSLRFNPVQMPDNIFGKNPYPEAGSYDKPFKPFRGKFPRIERDN